MLELAWGLVLVANLVAVALFGFDKWRSSRGGRRLRERTLLWLVFLAGWLGAWLAMAWFRHKTTKPVFRRWAVLWTVVNPFWLLVWRTFFVA